MWKGEMGIPDRRYSVLYNLSQTTSYVHVLAFAQNHPEVKRHLDFCKYLRANQAAAKRYEATKLELNRLPRSEYSEKKGPLIEALLKEATACMPFGNPR